jgi:two-component system KDP operon response regulator KdpE
LTYASSLGDAVRCVLAERPDGVVVAAESPAAAEACEIVRALGDVPVVVAGNGLLPEPMTHCLDAGADAFVLLTVPTDELVARLRVVLRRARRQESRAAAQTVTIGDVSIDLDSHSVYRGGVEVRLAPTEFNVLAVLAEQPGRVVTNEELLTRVWGHEYRDDVHYVRLYVGYLRQKLEADPSRPALIVNQWGVGYRLAATAQDAAGADLEPAVQPVV